MGSFAWTCCVSGLPVEAGDSVRFLALTKNQWAKDSGWTNYVHDRWRLRTVPLRGRYNDYGSVETFKKGLIEEVFFRSFDLDVIEKETGDNAFHDVPVKPGMEQEAWLQALWEGRIEVDPNYRARLPPEKRPAWLKELKKYRKKGVSSGVVGIPIQQAFIREDVWQLLLNMKPVYAYEADEVPFQKYLDGVDALIKDTEKQEKLLRDLSDTGVISEQEKALFSLTLSSDLASAGDFRENPVKAILHSPNYASTTFGLKDSLELAKELDPKRRRLREFLHDLAETVYVERQFASLRGQWGPTTGGSQFGEWALHGYFHAELTKLCAKKVKEQEES